MYQTKKNSGNTPLHNQGVVATAFDQYYAAIENMTRSVIEERPQNL